MNKRRSKTLRKMLLEKLGRIPTSLEWRNFKRDNRFVKLAEVSELKLKPIKLPEIIETRPPLLLQEYSFIHIVYTPFTGVGLYGGFKNQDWFDYRLKIFKEYTLPSLLNQTNKNFIHWISFRKEEESDNRVYDLANYMERLGHKFILTFDGLMYYDDKFSPDFRSRFMNLLRIIRYTWRTKDIRKLGLCREIIYNKNSTLEQRLKNSLPALKASKKCDYVYLTRIDSDDMFHKNAIQEIQNNQPFPEAILPFPGAILLDKGYVFNYNSKELAEWNPITNPPFHTIIFPYEHFIDSKKHYEYIKDYKSHEDIKKIFAYRILKDSLYCVLVHNEQISTIWNHPFKGKTILENKNEILSSFGIEK